MYSAIELSKYIIHKCVSDKSPISNLQLQKILYYIQKKFLQERDTRAFADEIEAWQFGPVVPDVYYSFCGFGSMPLMISYPNTISLEPADVNIIDEIVEAKRGLKPWQLVRETHKPNGAWEVIYDNGGGNHRIIPVSLIKEVG